MKIVINIPDGTYEKMKSIRVKGSYEEEYLKQVILNGIPLSKDKYDGIENKNFSKDEMKVLMKLNDRGEE